MVQEDLDKLFMTWSLFKLAVFQSGNHSLGDTPIFHWTTITGGRVNVGAVKKQLHGHLVVSPWCSISSLNDVYHWSNSSCTTFFEKIRFKITLILEVRSVKSPKKTHQKITKKSPPQKIHVCVWSKNTSLPPITGDIWVGWQPESFLRSFTFISPSWMSRVIVLYYVWYWGVGASNPNRPGGRVSVGWMWVGGKSWVGLMLGDSKW